MQIQPQDKQIDGITYRVGPLTAMIGRKLMIELKTILGPTIAELIRGVGSDFKSLLDMDFGALANSITAFAEDVTPEKYEYIVSTLATQSQYSTDGTNFVPLKTNPEHFCGRYLSEIKWLSFALEVNYSDFLSGLQNIQNVLGDLEGEMSRLKSQDSLIGISGESSQASDMQSV